MTTVYIIGGVVVLITTLFSLGIWLAYNSGRSRGSSDVKSRITEHELKVDNVIKDELIKPTTVDDTIDSLHRHDF